MNVVQVMFDTYPMFSSRAKRIQPFTGPISLMRSNMNGIVYLVRQGQQEVVEEDGGGRHSIILAAISHSEPQK